MSTDLNALNRAQAYQLVDVTKTPPQFGAITPRWLTRFLEFKGVDNQGLAAYLLSLYCSAAILADDALAVLEDAEVGEYYDYNKLDAASGILVGY